MFFHGTVIRTGIVRKSLVICATQLASGLLLKILKYFELMLKVQSCKLYNDKFVIASRQIPNTEIFAFIAVLVFKLSSCKSLFTNRKDNRNC